MYVDVPNILLQQAGELNLYVSITGETHSYTLVKTTFNVLARPKPADYVYTETDVLTWHALDKRIAELEKNPGGSVAPEEVQEAVNTALQAAKESGDFDGKNGVSATHEWNGTVLTMTSASGTSSADLKGDPGKTPVKGEDYWTQDDQQKIISDVLSALPTWTGGAY